MGMDLKPINPSKDAPLTHFDLDDDERYREYVGKYVWGRYNIHGWAVLRKYLEEWGIDHTELVTHNSGYVISDETCKKIADAIEQHNEQLIKNDDLWMINRAILWKTCGGYEQW